MVLCIITAKSRYADKNKKFSGIAKLGYKNVHTVYYDISYMEK